MGDISYLILIALVAIGIGFALGSLVTGFARRAVARAKAKVIAGSQPGAGGWRHDRPERQGGIFTGRRQGDPLDQ